MGGVFGVDSDRSGVRGGTDDGHRLPAVLHTAPAALLVIDPRRRQVVYANPAAIELAGERVRLPSTSTPGTPRVPPTSAGGG
jgi:PAS domain-containing protein